MLTSTKYGNPKMISFIRYWFKCNMFEETRKQSELTNWMLFSLFWKEILENEIIYPTNFLIEGKKRYL